MRTLSATEAITPAIDRAKALLQPFALGRWLKLGLVAMLAETTGSSFSWNNGGSSKASHLNFTASPVLLTVIAFAMVIAFLVAVVMLYVGSRMQLVLMDLVATRTTMVAPAWHRTASRTWRWIGLKVLCFLGLIILFAYPIFLAVRALAQNKYGVFGSIFLFIAVVCLIVLFIVLLVWFLRDFVLPFILFNDARLGDALRGAFALVRREPGEVAFYFLMKLVLTVALGIGGELCIVLAVIAIGLPTGGVGAALWFLLHRSGGFATAMMYAGFVILGIVFLAGLFVAVVCISGAVLIFYQSYALYFVGGRFPALGDLLEPPPPPMVYPQPEFNPL